MRESLGGLMSRVEEQVRESVHASVLPWYQGLAVREQRLVALAAAMFVVFFMLFGIITPLHDKVVAMRQEVAQLADQAGEASRLADILQHGGGGVVQQTDLLSAVEQAAVQTKVRSYMTRIRPQMGSDGHGQLAIQLRGAPYAYVVRFVAALNHLHIGLQRLRMQPASQPGYVHVEAVAFGS